jgi:hypothetical protein
MLDNSITNQEDSVAINQKIHIQINAEVIKRFHDTRNEGKFISDFPYEQALKNATIELKNDLIRGDMTITIDELLSYSIDDCVIIRLNRIKHRLLKTTKKFIKK